MPSIQPLITEKGGPLPIRGTFTPENDKIPSLFLSGTAWTSSGGGYMCMVELIVYDDKGVQIARQAAHVYANEPNQHKTLEAFFWNEKPFQFGMTYSFVIQAGNSGTIGDASDTYSALILY